MARHATARELLTAELENTLRRLTELERELAGIVSGPDGGDDEHDPEGATIAYERQYVAALLGQARERLAEIQAAQRKLDDGTYGQCDSCGEPIGADRLAARPTALTCIRCAARRVS
jgi:DnaK suppressor protein